MIGLASAVTESGPDDVIGGRLSRWISERVEFRKVCLVDLTRKLLHLPLYSKGMNFGKSPKGSLESYFRFVEWNCIGTGTNTEDVLYWGKWVCEIGRKRRGLLQREGSWRRLLREGYLNIQEPKKTMSPHSNLEWKILFGSRKELRKIVTWIVMNH